MRAEAVTFTLRALLFGDEFIRKAREDRKRADFRYCNRGYLHCQSQTCSCAALPDFLSIFVHARSALQGGKTP